MYKFLAFLCFLVIFLIIITPDDGELKGIAIFGWVISFLMTHLANREN